MVFLNFNQKTAPTFATCMFRQLLSLLLIIIFAANVFDRAVIVFDYYANTASFAKSCENKTRPMMHCNGKCQMMKKLQEEEKKDGQSPERKSENKAETALSTKSFFATQLQRAETFLEIKLASPLSQGKAIDRSFALFRPPIA